MCCIWKYYRECIHIVACVYCECHSMYALVHLCLCNVRESCGCVFRCICLSVCFHISLSYNCRHLFVLCLGSCYAFLCCPDAQWQGDLAKTLLGTGWLSALHNYH